MPPPPPLHTTHDTIDSHRLYKQKLEEVTKLQDSCSGAIARQRKKLKELTASLEGCKENHPNPRLNPEDVDAIAEMEDFIKDRADAFSEMEAFLPKKNGLYLALVLGNVNVTLLNKQSKFAYKDEYEKFKLVFTVLLFAFSFTCRVLFSSRALDALFNFLLVWYYCTLTIRESVLISNGSRIKGWWVFHHYVSTFQSGVMLTWPDGALYQMFRNQFLTYCLYQSFVQFLQYYYQSGCLYRLRALGEKHNMDVTVEGFQSWMWRGLTFLLPFLFFGHFLQLYNSITLFQMFQLPECKEWQVCVHQRLLFFYNPISLFFFPRCCGAGCDVRRLLHGALHGQRLYHAGRGLPEVHEQQVQELMRKRITPNKNPCLCGVCKATHQL
uniref:Transmembrane protein 120Aa n=1 Tax=Cyclopterus lumpus TaxID=8103 RepID=A0A8C2WHI1_CYCLU